MDTKQLEEIEALRKGAVKALEAAPLINGKISGQRCVHRW